MKRIDLHVHSSASDGSFTPMEVADLAIGEGLSAIALTDHDTIDGICEILPYAAQKDLEVVPGIELSCYYKEREIHILGFYIDYKNADLQKELNALKEARYNRNLKMIELMQKDGIPVTLEKLLHGSEEDSVITRAHFARVLVEEGVCPDHPTAFRDYIGTGCKYYLPKPQVTCVRAMEILTKYAKAAFLAHPLLYHLDFEEIETLLIYLKSLGLKGVEAYHSTTSPVDSQKLCQIASRLNLEISGGSDFHGVPKPDIQIGIGRGNLKIPMELLDNLKSCC